MKELKNINTKLHVRVYGPVLKPFPICIADFSSSDRITKKYLIVRKSATLPSLLFLKLFSGGPRNQISNVYRRETINNYINLRFNLYFKMISRLERTLRNYHLSRKLSCPIECSEIDLRTESKTYSSYLPHYKNISLLIRNVFENNFSMSSGMSAFEDRRLPQKTITKSEISFFVSNLLLPKRGFSISFEKRGEGSFFYKYLFNSEIVNKILTSQRLHKITDPHFTGRSELKLDILKGVSPDVMGSDTLISGKNHDIFLRRITDKYSRTINEDTPLRSISHMPPLIISSPVGVTGPTSTGPVIPVSTLKDLLTNTAIKTDMTLRKSTAQNATQAVENREIIRRQSSISNRIHNLESAHIPKEASAPEINKIADSVYKIIERKIVIEKERRGQ